jgi:hypothetical protein
LPVLHSILKTHVSFCSSASRRLALDTAFSYLPYSNIMFYAYKKYRAHQARRSPASTDTAASRPGTAVGSSSNAGDRGENNAVELNEKKTRSPEQVAEDRKRRVYRWKVILGLFGPFALQALDTTVIASALPYIATDFSASTLLLPPLLQ